MSQTLFCGNLAFATVDADLEAHVRAQKVAGVKSVNIARKGDRSKGWGLIEFDTHENAIAAIPKLHDTVVDGRPLRVREDQPDTKKSKPIPVSAPAAPKGNNSGPRIANNTRDFESEAPAPPSNRLYVGNLPWEVTPGQLLDMFKPYRATSADIAKRLSGRSKGFGTVEFPTVQDATDAMNKMANHVIEDRTLSLRFDRISAPSVPSSRLFVGNLPWSADDAALASMFTGFGVESASVKSANGRSRGFGIVSFVSVSEAERALKSKGEFDFEGRRVFARFDRDPIA